MGCGGSRRFLPVLLFAATADGLWTAADVDRVVCNALRNSNASGGCPPAPPAPFPHADLPLGARVALALVGQVRTFFEEPLRTQWRRVAASAGEGVVVFAALGHGKGFREARVCEFFGELGLPCHARFVNVDADAAPLLRDASLAATARRPHQFQQGGASWRISAPLKRLVALDALLAWERARGERFRAVVVARCDVVVPGLLEDAAGAPRADVARILAPDVAFLLNDVFAALPRAAAPAYLLQYATHLDLADLHRVDRPNYGRLDAVLRPPAGARDPGYGVKGSLWQPTTALAFYGVPFGGAKLEVFTGAGDRFDQRAPVAGAALSDGGPCAAPYYLVRSRDAAGRVACLEDFPVFDPGGCVARLFNATLPTC